jgi:hypothetical protein
MITSRRMRLVGHAACDKRGVHTWFWLKIWKERDHSEDLDGDGRIALNGWGVLAGFIWFRIGTNDRLLLT